MDLQPKPNLKPELDLKPEYWLSEKEVSRIFKISLRKLQKDRQCGRGFPCYKIGRTIRYYLPELKQYVISNKVTPAFQGGAR